MANKENIRKWVVALRSGKYQQVQGKLSDGIGYCCLGVACEVAIENGIALSRKETLDTTGTQVGKRIEFDDECGELPAKVSYWLDLVRERDAGDFYPISDVPLPEEGGNDRAIAYNDSGYDFNKIADLIEKQYLSAELGDRIGTQEGEVGE